jgi:aminoglycoside phosphotransferase family enzyme/predicted kinase
MSEGGTAPAIRDVAGGSIAPAVTETHISVLISLGDRVYKLKKPVSFGFVDFSQREMRRRACHREVELNRRLAPDVYLGVADVVGEDGAVCDHLVVMRRMPADRRLAALVRSGAEIDGELRDIARRLAVFHAAAATGPEIAAAARVENVGALWERSFTQIHAFVGPVLDPKVCNRVEWLVRRYLTGRAALFDHRIALGAARDGHGDVQAEDIFCLDDGPRILDCIEFADELRYGDVLADVAFLAMDLERLGAPAAATSFVRHYEELAGTTFPASLLHHYIAARAHVRAKVACLRHDQGDPEAATEARDLLGLARRHLEAARVRLVLIGGLPGTGKSTVADRLAGATGWTLLRSDEIRKDLAGVAHIPPAPAAPGEGLYGPRFTGVTYAALLERAAGALERGESVILDASWADARHRDAAASLARSTASDLVELCCRAPADLADRRIRARLARRDDQSDATPEVAAAMAARFDPWPTSIGLDTTVALSTVVPPLDVVGCAPGPRSEGSKVPRRGDG